MVIKRTLLSKIVWEPEMGRKKKEPLKMDVFQSHGIKMDLLGNMLVYTGVFLARER